MSDIYFEPNYGKLYEKMENGKCEIFEYASELGTVYHMFIKREIDSRVDGIVWYDLITPYGYGGPIITECKKGCRNDLVKQFESKFAEYCKINRIVSEFIRFHPIVGNAKDFKDIYDIFYLRNTVGTSLADFDDPFQSEFSKSCRKNIRRALKAGVTYRITENPRDIGSFKKIYYSTMDRNKASDFYYFDDEYFGQCIELLDRHLLLVEAIYNDQTIAEGLYFIYEKNIHIHLSGTLSDFLHLSPAYILRYAITEWGKEKGYKLIHHGGGRTNSPDDDLYLFKKRFGQNTEFEFHIGKKIWNEELYKKLCNKKGIDFQVDFFPAYRKEI